MIYTLSLYIALAIFAIGLVYRCKTWLSYKIGDLAHEQQASGRFGSAVKGIFSVLFSAGILTLAKEFFVNVIFQWKVFKENRLRWVMHMLIYAGFMLLFFFHALAAVNGNSHPFFSEFHSTANPYLFLRNLFGLMLIAGVAIAIYRRVKIKGMRRTTSPIDRYAIVILAVILISGVLLEACKIVSYRSFERMVHEYMDPGINIADYQNDEEVKALMAYWQEEYHVVFPKKIEADNALLEQGAAVSNDNQCSACHAAPQSAFMSYGVASVITPVANLLTAARAATWLWYIHFLACFAGLAYLPFSKFVHIFSTPVSLLANSVMKNPAEAPAANVATRRAMELDACTHCSTCSMRCSVAQIYDRISNITILPSEKLVALKALAEGKNLADEQLIALAEGSHICTNCFRCTKVCPAGINLQDLWFSIREELARRGYPEPYVVAREKITQKYSERAQGVIRPFNSDGKELRHILDLSAQADTFAYCYECQTCTNSCPVVMNYENPRETLGLLPHQIMHSLVFGLRDEALSSRMVWDCVTCYQCQESCPQGVKVADILYELKQMGYADLKAGMSTDAAARKVAKG